MGENKAEKLVFNPYLPAYEYIADAEPRVFNNRLYVFGSHDRFGSDEFCPNDYVCWSASIEDLSEWKYEGVIYKKEQDPRSKGMLPMYAPDVVRGPDGKYYLFYSTQNTSVLSVAVSDIPAGNYEYYGDVRREDGHIWGDAKEDWFEFDPAVLVDDDGRIWLYSGSGQKYNRRFGHPVVGAFVHQLREDMLTTVGEPRIIMPYERLGIFKPAFFEGSSIRKINGLYYFIYAATNVTGLNYCVSKYPDRDFVWKGCLHNTSDIGIQGHSLFHCAYPIGNYHGSMIQIKDDFYIFDHRMTNNNMYNRQGVAEKLIRDAEGGFQQAESTSCGLLGECLPWKGTYPSHIACNLMDKTVLGFRNPVKGPYVTQTGDDREENEDSYITGIGNGMKIGYKYFKFDGKNRQIEIKVRGHANGILQVLDGEKGVCVSKYQLNISTDNWESMKNSMKALNGKQPLFFYFKGKGTFDLKEFSLK